MYNGTILDKQLLQELATITKAQTKDIK